MLIIIPQENLSSLLSKAQSILERKSTRPILENVLLQAHDGILRVSSTDLRVSLVQETPCTVHIPGSIAVAGRKIHEILREMPKSPVTLETKENGWITISAGKSLFHLPAIPSDEYPTLPNPPTEFALVDCHIFRSMLDKTLFASSNDESRIYLCGVFIKTHTDADQKQKLRMVATDGHRLSLSEQLIETQLDTFHDGVILPKKGLSELRSLLETSIEKFKLSTSEGKIFIQLDSTVLSITLIDATFPNYEQVIPIEVEEKVSINKGNFIDALKRVSLLSDQETHTIIMETNNENTILKSTNAAYGDAREEISSTYDGESIRVAFNSVYLLEAVRSIQGDNLLMSIGDALAPCLLKSSDELGHLCVVMPMRID